MHIVAAAAEYFHGHGGAGATHVFRDDGELSIEFAGHEERRCREFGQGGPEIRLHAGAQRADGAGQQGRIPVGMTPRHEHRPHLRVLLERREEGLVIPIFEKGAELGAPGRHGGKLRRQGPILGRPRLAFLRCVQSRRCRFDDQAGETLGVVYGEVEGQTPAHGIAHQIALLDARGVQSGHDSGRTRRHALDFHGPAAPSRPVTGQVDRQHVKIFRQGLGLAHPVLHTPQESVEQEQGRFLGRSRQGLRSNGFQPLLARTVGAIHGLAKAGAQGFVHPVGRIAICRDFDKHRSGRLNGLVERGAEIRQSDRSPVGRVEHRGGGGEAQAMGRSEAFFEMLRVARNGQVMEDSAAVVVQDDKHEGRVDLPQECEGIQIVQGGQITHERDGRSARGHGHARRRGDVAIDAARAPVGGHRHIGMERNTVAVHQPHRHRVAEKEQTMCGNLLGDKPRDTDLRKRLLPGVPGVQCVPALPITAHQRLRQARGYGVAKRGFDGCQEFAHRKGHPHGNAMPGVAPIGAGACAQVKGSEFVDKILQALRRDCAADVDHRRRSPIVA